MDIETSNRAIPDLPPELAGPLPRKVEMNPDGDARFALIVVLLFFVPGLFFLGWKGYDYARQFKQRSLLRGEVGNVVGRVTGFSFGRFSPMSVDYTFSVNGVTYFGEALEAGSGRGSSLNKGDDIPIRFLPSNPAINHPAAWEWSPTTGWYFVVGEVFFTSMGALALALLLRDRRLARHGKVAAGIVTNCTRDDRWFRVDYEFRTGDGALATGHNDFKDEYATGARVWILYLPQKPKRNHSYPLSLYSVLE